MSALIGLGLAAVVAAFAQIVGLDRGPAFYPTVLIIVASYYVLFAIVGERHDALPAHLIICGLFVGIAVLGFLFSPWFTVAGLAGHGVFDFAHRLLAADSGAPNWWPSFCLAFDVAAAAALAAILMSRGPISSKPKSRSDQVN